MGERDYRIFVENLNNVADTLAVDIITSVVSESHREGLRIETEREGLLEGGSVLQFDNYHTGIPVSRQLRIKNTTVQAMDISLGSDRPGEVSTHRASYTMPTGIFCFCFTSVAPFFSPFFLSTRRMLINQFSILVCRFSILIGRLLERFGKKVVGLGFL